MLVTNHVLAGALIGRVLARKPCAAFAAGVLSHFAMDSCPHWGPSSDGRSKEFLKDETFLRVARCDGCAGLAAMALVASVSPGGKRTAVIAAMVGAAIPDADKPFEYFLGWNPFPERVQLFHARLQREAPHRLPYEVAVAGILGVLVHSITRSWCGGLFE